MYPKNGQKQSINREYSSPDSVWAQFGPEKFNWIECSCRIPKVSKAKEPAWLKYIGGPSLLLRVSISLLTLFNIPCFDLIHSEVVCQSVRFCCQERFQQMRRGWYGRMEVIFGKDWTDTPLPSARWLRILTPYTHDLSKKSRHMRVTFTLLQRCWLLASLAKVV